MSYEQPDFITETPSESFMPPMLRLPQISLGTPMPMVVTPQFRRVADTAHMPSQAQFPVSPPHTEPLSDSFSMPQAEDNERALLPRPQVPFPMQHRAITRSLRSGVTYIPPSMKRHAEPNMIDALTACVILLLLVLCVALLLYYFSL